MSVSVPRTFPVVTLMECLSKKKKNRRHFVSAFTSNRRDFVVTSKRERTSRRDKLVICQSNRIANVEREKLKLRIVRATFGTIEWRGVGVARIARRYFDQHALFMAHVVRELGVSRFVTAL